MMQAPQGVCRYRTTTHDLEGVFDSERFGIDLPSQVSWAESEPRARRALHMFSILIKGSLWTPS